LLKDIVVLSPMDDPHAALYTVGQVAEMLGVTAAFLRRLDAEGLVRPARSPGGQRRYTRREIDRVQRVAELAGDGLSLTGVRRLLSAEAEVADLQRQLTREKARTRRARAKSQPPDRHDNE
jgi:DNA-binding transcriptional MerR regulator